MYPGQKRGRFIYGVILRIDPICFALFFFPNLRSHELFFAGPSTIELALDISSGPRYCLMYYTYYLCTIATEKNLGPYKESCHEPTPFSSLRIFINFYPHEFPFTWPSKIELALEISSAARCCVMYYTYYLSTAPLQTHFASHSPPERS